MSTLIGSQEFVFVALASLMEYFQTLKKINCFFLNSLIEVYFRYHKIQPLQVYSSMICSNMELCDHYHNPVLEHFHHLKKPPHAHWSLLFYPKFQATTNLLSASMDLPFQMFHINAIV